LQPTVRPPSSPQRGRRLAGAPSLQRERPVSPSSPQRGRRLAGAPSLQRERPVSPSSPRRSRRPPHTVPRSRACPTGACILLLALLACLSIAGRAAADPYSAGEIVVGYRSSTARVRVRTGETVAFALARLRHVQGVLWAEPDYIAHATGQVVPNDPGIEGSEPGGWRAVQWNFAGTFGVGAPEAWFNVAQEGAPGGRGVVVAVLDTGVAYEDRGRFRRSPDFAPSTFVPGYDFIARNSHPDDRNGHGTFVAGTIAEATDNGRGLTGLAWGVRIMPVRVLDDAGEGDASVIAEGIRYAVRHHARIINMSLEFSNDVHASDIPELISALRYARRHRVIVVAAAGNEDSTNIPYPARGPAVIAVGASTEHGCLAAYSNHGAGIALVAPGGGADANLPGDPNCNPVAPSGRDIFQMTFTGSSPDVFGFPIGYEGTSMATPHVAATAALILAARLLGANPTPAQVTARLKGTARPLGGTADRRVYGAGLLDAAAATAPMPRAAN
jgi:serine protease